MREANTTLPIVWFGNLEKYFSSEPRIVTLGLNPSNQEFEKERFPGVASAFGRQDYIAVYNGLNKYFVREPYEWFNSYERVLSCSKWNATYGGNISKNPWATNCAIHIDFFSAVAPHPTWSNLDDYSKTELQRKDLFDELLKFLCPNIILFSTSKKEICDHFHLESNILSGKNLTVGINGLIEEYFGNTLPGTLFIWGKPNIKPFQGVTATKLIEFFKNK